MLEKFEPRFSFFRFSANERAAALLLIFLGLLGALTPYWLRYFWPDEPVNTQISAELQAEMDDWIARSEARADSLAAAREAARQAKYASFRQNRYPSSRTYDKRTSSRRSGRRDRYATEVDLAIPLPTLGSLDPNSADSASLKRLGVPVAIVRRWYKFRESGATFVRRADISKLYGMRDSTFERIAPYFLPDEQIVAPASTGRRGRSAEARPQTAAIAAEAPTPLVEVNNATAGELVAVRGIGDYYAKRILDYRDALGGFTSLEQVAATPGLREGAFERFADQLTVDPNELVPLKLNLADQGRLRRHPFIDRADARVLVDYRNNNGPYRSLDDVYATVAVDSATVRRLAPYLNFEY